MKPGHLLLLGLRAVAIVAPIAAGLLYGTNIVLLEYQKSLCPKLGSYYNGGFESPFVSIAILVTPWLLVAIWQLLRFRGQLSLLDAVALVVIGLGCWSFAESANWFFVPKLDGPRCDFLFWRHFNLEAGQIELAVFPIGIAAGGYLIFLVVTKLASRWERRGKPK